MYMVYGYEIMYDGGAFLAGIQGGDTLVADALSTSKRKRFLVVTLFMRKRQISSSRWCLLPLPCRLFLVRLQNA